MNLKLLISDFYHTPLKYFIPKILNRFKMRGELNGAFRNDLASPSFIHKNTVDWSPVFSLTDIKGFEEEIVSNRLLTEKYIAHYFDILGSGWIDCGYSNKSPGFMGHSYQADWNIPQIDSEGNWLKTIVNDVNFDDSFSIWKTIQDLKPSYIPIDWQRDIRSGYRYNSKEHFSRIEAVTGITGVDVKVPWEFGRLQHLPVMAISNLEKDASSDQVVKEIKCQILDFIMSNPPRWGVQWTSSMDVSIRILNIIVTMEVLLQLNPEIKSSGFYNLVCNSIKEHVFFAWKFREHKNGLSNNHYLANLLGVVYGSFVFQKDKELEILLRTSLTELWKELDKQFLDDGGNFESSIPYHFFSSEIAALTMAITKRIEADNKLKISIDTDLRKRVENKFSLALDLMESCIFDNGNIPQIGDNDSARMIYLTIPYTVLSGDEASDKYKNLNWLQGDDDFMDRNYLDYNSSLEMGKACFENKAEKSLHTAFINSISKSQSSKSNLKNQSKYVLDKSNSNLKYSEETVYKINNKSLNLRANISVDLYNDFGLYIFKGDNIHLIVNGTNRHVKQYWPHSHNDKLSFELWIGGRAIIRDPGSFVYTALPEERNKYRSIHAHATIIFENEEQNNWIEGIQGVFRTIPKVKVELLSVNDNSLRLKSTYKKYIHEREFIIENDRVLIKDFASHAFIANKAPDIPFSNGYGKMLN